MNRERADRLVSLRAAREDTIKRQVAAVQARVTAVRARIEELRAEVERQRSVAPEGPVAGADLARAEAYVERLRDEIASQQRALELAEGELAELREALTDAARERMAAETVLDREEDALVARGVAHEQSELDDTSARIRPQEER